MILSAIGLPVPGTSSTSFPPPVAERAESTVQAITAATASGGSTSARGSDIGRGDSGRGDPSARRSPPDSDAAIGRGRSRSDGADRPAGPQPAFEIAVLDKLREDAMRIPPEGPVTDQDDPATSARGSVPSVGSEEKRAADLASESASPRSPTGTDAADETAGATASGADRNDPARAEVKEAKDAADQRPREPADDGFGDARRMSENPVPRSLDLTR